MLAIVGLGVVLVVLGCIWFYRTWLTEPANAPPLVRYEGSVFKPMILWTTDPGKLLRYAKEKYGDVFTLYMGFFKLTVFTDLDAFQWLPKATEEELSFSKNIKRFLIGMLGWETVKERSQEEHYERADKIGKVLNNHLEHFFVVMQEEVEKWAEKIANSGQAVDWEKEMDNLVMNINMVSFLGPDMTEENSRRFVELYDELETKGVTAGALLFHWLPWGNGARCAQIRKEISDILRPIIVRRQKEYSELGITHEDYLNDFIVYPHKNKEEWTVEEMIERVISVFFAARVNTMKTLFWTTLNIALRPEVLQEVRRLVDNNELTYKNLKSSTVFKYLDNVMRETVRPMYFTNPASRTNQKDVQYKQYVIPAGYVVGASAYFLNRDDQYFPEPEKFLPERWNDDALLKNVWRFFGAGTHRCRGEQYATLKIRTVLHTLFKHYVVEWVDKKEDGVLPEYQFTFTLGQALTPVMVKLTPRKPVEQPIVVKRGFPDDIPRIRKQMSDDKLLQHKALPVTLRQQQSQQSQVEEDDDRRATPSLF